MCACEPVFALQSNTSSAWTGSAGDSQSLPLIKEQQETSPFTQAATEMPSQVCGPAPCTPCTTLLARLSHHHTQASMVDTSPAPQGGQLAGMPGLSQEVANGGNRWWYCAAQGDSSEAAAESHAGPKNPATDALEAAKAINAGHSLDGMPESAEDSHATDAPNA